MDEAAAPADAGRPKPPPPAEDERPPTGRAGSPSAPGSSQRSTPVATARASSSHERSGNPPGAPWVCVSPKPIRRVASGDLAVAARGRRRRRLRRQDLISRTENDYGDPVDLGRRDFHSEDEIEAAALERSGEDRHREHNAPSDADEGNRSSSDGEFSIKGRQDELNSRHPFGVRLWKPALYKKNRSINRFTAEAVHASPNELSELYILRPGNVLYALLVGWWLGLVTFVLAIVAACLPPGSRVGKQYTRVLLGLAGYVFWPFGKYVEEVLPPQAEENAIEDLLEVGGAAHTSCGYSSYQGESDEEPGLHCPSEQSQRPLLGDRPSLRADGGFLQAFFFGDRQCRHRRVARLRRLELADIVFYLMLYAVIAPLYLAVSVICFWMIITIPIAKLMRDLIAHLHRAPLSLRFKRGPSADDSLSDTIGSCHAAASNAALSASRWPSSVVLLGTRDAVGLRYFKFCIDGTNIIFFNLLFVVFFTLLDALVLLPLWGPDTFLTHFGTIFILCLLSIVPLAYFIGQGVGSISAQSSLGMGAVINATFGSIVEVILYCMALSQGKAVLVEGSIVGSFLGSLLLLPGLSMIAGGIKRKFQRFNAKSAGVTSTMLIFSIIGVCTPTLFYNSYGRFEMKCVECSPSAATVAMPIEACRRCYYAAINPLTDEFFHKKAKPLMYLCACILPLAYVTGLWFTLRTHASHIYADGLGQCRFQSSHGGNSHLPSCSHCNKSLPTVRRQPPTSCGTITPNTAAVIRDRLAATFHLNGIVSSSTPRGSRFTSRKDTGADDNAAELQRSAIPSSIAETPKYGYPACPSNLEMATSPSSPIGAGGDAPRGHDAPNWGKAKSAFVLCACTALFSAIAEVLVDSIDPVIEHMHIDEKVLGLTLFALVPSVTEFVNAIAFAVYNNIALSMEIGSAYAVQVALLQIPALVAFTASTQTVSTNFSHMFTLIFPSWDILSLVFAVFLLSYVYIEGKSNYFKGTMLVLAYCVLIASFFFAPTARVREGNATETIFAD